MSETEKTLKNILERAAQAAGVPVYHAPAPSSGERVIYTFTPGGSDGIWETFSLNMRFISAAAATAISRADAVTRALCAPGDATFSDAGGYTSFVVRGTGGGSGFIGRSGHFFALATFQVKLRVS